MKKLPFVALLLLLTVTGLLAGSLIATAAKKDKSWEQSAQVIEHLALSKLSPWVVENTTTAQEAEFLVVLVEQADLSLAVSLQTKEEKGRFVFDTLRAKAQATQGPLLDWLKERQIVHRPFYIVNALWVKGTREIAIEIASRPDVARIEGNPQLSGITPVPINEDDAVGLTASPNGIEVGVGYIRAPEVWAMGFTGQGIVIGGQDTGVRWNHPALLAQYRGWDGLNANHDYNWHDSVHSGGGDCGPDSKTPCDDDNHGTHTLGTAVGTDGGTNQTGVAPGAKYIACRNMDRGKGTPATYLECFQFILAPIPVNGALEQGDPLKAPHITTNSWTCPPTEGCSPNTLKAAVEAQRAAGIMTVVAAGNTGAICSTIVDPPALYDASYSIGALNATTGNIAPFSGRGPVTIDSSNRIKPDITAPGVGVRSALRNGGYGPLSGTSMAAPHVAGAVALLWSAYPELRGQIEMTENILNESAVRIELSDCNSNGFPNNVYGFGRLDIKAAFDLAATRLSPVEQVFGIRGGAGKVDVAALAHVTWRAVSNDSWITITSVNTGIGAGVVTIFVTENTSPDPRTGTVMIAGRTVKITQPGAAPLFAVTGRVVTSNGEAIGKVTLQFTRISGGGEVPAETQTDENGNWSQSGFEPGTTYRVTANRIRMLFAPSSYDFSAASNMLDFTSVGRRIAISTQP
ncbi:MAG: S8 family serine peptidase [Acidobacteria bacterium]|nr:S8 family serine peptidase [Acidobacteriota bacterium]